MPKLSTLEEKEATLTKTNSRLLELMKIRNNFAKSIIEKYKKAGVTFERYYLTTNREVSGVEEYFNHVRNKPIWMKATEEAGYIVTDDALAADWEHKEMLKDEIIYDCMKNNKLDNVKVNFSRDTMWHPAEDPEHYLDRLEYEIHRHRAIIEYVCDKLYDEEEGKKVL
jgi:hypothetical protein